MTRVFVDSDVVISALLSSSGAANFLLQKKDVKPVISTVSLKELRIVAKRMEIKLEKLEKLIRDRFEVIKILQSLNQVKKKYNGFVIDINDAHIIAGVKEAGVKYLVSYNIRHFKTDQIKEEFGVLLFTPALFLQYLRSQ